jgi:hypothetical protein
MVRILLIFLITVNGNIGFADEVVFVKKGEPTPFTGVLFTEHRSNQIRKELIDSDISRVRLSTEEERNRLLRQAIKLRDDEIELLRRKSGLLERQNKQTETMKYIYFGLGILATGMAVYGAGALSR